jgi:hypothetical protein
MFTQLRKSCAQVALGTPPVSDCFLTLIVYVLEGVGSVSVFPIVLPLNILLELDVGSFLTMAPNIHNPTILRWV